MKIDSHQHFWQYDPLAFSWIGESMSTIRRDFLPCDLESVIEPTDIDGVISVQARQSIEETQWLLELAEANEFIKGVVGWVPLVDPAVSDVLQELSKHASLKGVRHVVHDEPDDEYMLRNDFNSGITQLKKHGLVYDILIFEQHLPHTIEFVDQHPEQLFVVDHISKPKIAAGQLDPWEVNIRQLAKRANVFCKVSGMVTEADWKGWDSDSLRIYFDIVLEAFGPQRVMFGSDWPVCLVASKYERWIQVVSDWIGLLSINEQDQFWGGTATTVYQLDTSPQKSN